MADSIFVFRNRDTGRNDVVHDRQIAELAARSHGTTATEYVSADALRIQKAKAELAEWMYGIVSHPHFLFHSQTTKEFVKRFAEIK